MFATTSASSHTSLWHQKSKQAIRRIDGTPTSTHTSINMQCEWSLFSEWYAAHKSWMLHSAPGCRSHEINNNIEYQQQPSVKQCVKCSLSFLQSPTKRTTVHLFQSLKQLHANDDTCGSRWTCSRPGSSLSSATSAEKAGRDTTALSLPLPLTTRTQTENQEMPHTSLKWTLMRPFCNHWYQTLRKTCAKTRTL